jgi:hypothetical protein
MAFLPGPGLLALTLLQQPAPAPPQTIDRLAAVVGGEPIFLSDVREALRLRLFDPASPLAPLAGDAGETEEARVLERLINRRLVLAEVARYSLVPPPEADVNEAMKAWAARFTEPPPHDAAIVRAFLVDSLRIERYLDLRFSTAAQPDPAARLAVLREWLRGLRDRSQVRVIR